MEIRKENQGALQAPFGKIKKVVLLNADFSVDLIPFLAFFAPFFVSWNGADKQVIVLNRSMERTLPYPSAKKGTIPKTDLGWLECPVSLANLVHSMANYIVGEKGADILEYLWQMGSQNPLYPTDAFSTVWKEEGGASYIVCPQNYTNGNCNLYQLFAGQALSYGTGIQQKSISLKFDGGNLFACGPVLFVGEDVYLDSVLQNKQSALQREELSQQLCKDFHAQQVVWLSSPSRMIPWPIYGPILGVGQPLYHVDVFFMPLGLIHNPKNGQWKYHVAVAKPYWWVDGEFTQPAEGEFMQESLDFVANQLREITIGGFPVQVSRLPLVFYLNREANLALQYIPLSYMNGLVENAGANDRTAYLPSYRFEGNNEMEKEAETELSLLGFKVKWVGGTYSFPKLNLGGALHCLVNVVERDPV